MSSFAERFKSEFFKFHQPEWQRRMPRRLRLAAQWQFGTFPLTALVMLVTGNFAFSALSAGFSGFLFLFTGGWSLNERFKHPVPWWGFVMVVSATGFFCVVGGIVKSCG